MRSNRLLVVLLMLLGVACDGDVAGPELEPVARVDVAAPATMLVVGAALQLTATPRAADGTPLEGRAVSWSSSEETVARVSGTGLVTGRGAGTVWIHAEIGGRRGAVQLVVHSTRVARVTIDPAGEIVVDSGASVQLRALAFDADDIELADRPVTWSASDDRVATVTDEGLVVARGGGVTWVTATSEGVSGQARVTVPGWAEATLARLDGRSLPAVWRTFTVTDDRGIELTRRIKVAAGALRVDRGNSRYDQQLTLEMWEDVYVIVNGEPVFWGVQLKETRVFDDHGSAGPIHSGVSTLVFRSEVIEGHEFTGLPAATGFDVTERINGFGDPVLLQFER